MAGGILSPRASDFFIYKRFNKILKLEQLKK